MNIKFVIDDYILTWNLLFNASPSKDIHKLKQKLWINYKNEYSAAYKDKIEMLNDAEDYIPDDDTIYNSVLESEEYQVLKKEVEHYRLRVLKIWNKRLNEQLERIFKKSIQKCTFFLVGEKFNILDVINIDAKIIVTLGYEIDRRNPNKFISDILYKILDKEINNYDEEDQVIRDAIIEMAIDNELNTNLTGKSKYFEGREEYLYIKRQIYPYWLMYLGISRDNMKVYMKRDRIIFDLERYPYREQLTDYDLGEFIDFCIKHKRHIINAEYIGLI